MMQPASIPSTIELAPKQAVELDDLADLVPPGTRTYVTDLGSEDDDETLRAVERLRFLGLEPVPHLAARRVTSERSLRGRIERLRSAGDVRDVLIIGGGLDKPAGPYDSTMAVLGTGVIEGSGITHVGVAGHPEGSPDFDDDAAFAALEEKRTYAAKNGLSLRIVTQFGFDPKATLAWVDDLAARGIDMPIHLGVAGPATLKTLLRYAAFCGVGASMQFLKRNALKIAALAQTQSPETVVGPIEERWKKGGTAIAGLHTFPFGGTAKSSAWLRERGSWPAAAHHRTAAE